MPTPNARTTRLYEHHQGGQGQGRQSAILFKAGKRPYDLARFQYHHTPRASSCYTRTLELLEKATPRAGIFSR